MKDQSFDLPWPPASLSPNGSHDHWSKKAKARRSYNAACRWELIAQGVKKMDAERLHVGLCFYPPRNGRFDLDNALARLKSGLDAVSQHIGIDDSQWTYALARGPSEKLGRVAVTLRSIDVEMITL